MKNKGRKALANNVDNVLWPTSDLSSRVSKIRVWCDYLPHIHYGSFVSQLDDDASTADTTSIAQPRASGLPPLLHSFTPQGVQFSSRGKMVLYKSLKPSPPIRLPRLPPSVKTANRYYFYGWHYTPEWLEDLAAGRPGIRSILSGEWTITDGILYIAKYTGYTHVHAMGGVVEDDRIYEGATWEDGKQTIDVISIYVNHPKRRHRRPTEEQLERLIHIFGREPMWFQDCNPPELFGSYAVQDLTSVLIANGE